MAARLPEGRVSAIEQGPLNVNELTDEQRSVWARLEPKGWTAVILGYVTGCLYLRHDNGRQCILHPDGRTEAVEPAT